MIIFLLVIAILIILNIYAYLDMVKHRERYYVLLNISDYEKTRISGMMLDSNCCLCPNCKSIVIPRFHNHFPGKRSGLYWCPKCYKGKAGMCWKSFGLIRDLSKQKLKELKEEYENPS